jgi:hypothetical protein
MPATVWIPSLAVVVMLCVHGLLPHDGWAKPRPVTNWCLIIVASAGWNFGMFMILLHELPLIPLLRYVVCVPIALFSGFAWGWMSWRLERLGDPDPGFG